MPPARRRALLALAAAALLAACDGRHEPPIGSSPAERAPLPSAAAAAGPPLFVGRWASTTSVCASKAWVLTAKRLSSPSALSCEVSDAEPTPAGYTVYGSCSVGKASQATHLMFTLTGTGRSRSLTLSGGPFPEPIALAHCPDELQSAARTATVGAG